jgi:hypothetical protein
MTMDELMEYILREFPNAVFGEDSKTGEVLVETGLKLVEGDELVEIVSNA